MRGFSIRRAVLSDAPNVTTLINAVGAEGVWLATDQYTPTPQWEQVLHGLESDPRALLLVAEAHAQIVGWCRVFPYLFGGKSLHVADIGIGVHQAFRRRGIGRALMDGAITWARGQAYAKLTLDLYASSEIAQRLFQTIGFRVIGVRVRHARINNSFVDEILMEMVL